MRSLEFRSIVGYEGHYEVSNTGLIISLKRGGRKVMKGSLDSYGYLLVSLNLNGEKTHKIHRLVALTFIPNPENKKEVNHLDGDKTNNNVSNLEWSTYEENMQHSRDIGLRQTYGSKSHLHKIVERDATKIREERDSGVPVKVLANKYGLSSSGIYKVLSGTTWRRV